MTHVLSDIYDWEDVMFYTATNNWTSSVINLNIHLMVFKDKQQIPAC